MLDPPALFLEMVMADRIRDSTLLPGVPLIVAFHSVPGTFGSLAGAVASVHVAGHVISPCDRVWYWNPSSTTAAGWG